MYDPVHLGHIHYTIVLITSSYDDSNLESRCKKIHKFRTSIRSPKKRLEC